jgi:hypothetical protein
MGFYLISEFIGIKKLLCYSILIFVDKLQNYRGFHLADTLSCT